MPRFLIIADTGLMLLRGAEAFFIRQPIGDIDESSALLPGAYAAFNSDLRIVCGSSSSTNRTAEYR